MTSGGCSQYNDRLHKSDYFVRDIPLKLATEITKQHHYARGGSNTHTYAHGLFKESDRDTLFPECQGITWWIPPTKSAALATYPTNWRGVLSLSRLVIVPDVPKNACTFLLGRSMKMIDRQRWPCLVTYADTWQGHDGGIYKASNWKYEGQTSPEATWLLNGRMVARKAGPRTRTKAEMEGIGAEMIGRFSKHKYVHIQASGLNPLQADVLTVLKS